MGWTAWYLSNNQVINTSRHVKVQKLRREECISMFYFSSFFFLIKRERPLIYCLIPPIPPKYNITPDKARSPELNLHRWYRWQGYMYLDHHPYFPNCPLAGSWTGKRGARTQTRHSDLGCRHPTWDLKCCIQTLLHIDSSRYFNNSICLNKKCLILEDLYNSYFTLYTNSRWITTDLEVKSKTINVLQENAFITLAKADIFLNMA